MTNVKPAAAIEARDLVKTYRGDVRALQSVSFRVDAGTMFALLGPNGAGSQNQSMQNGG